MVKNEEEGEKRRKGGKENIGRCETRKQQAEHKTCLTCSIGISEGCRVSEGEKRAVASLYCVMIARWEECSVQIFAPYLVNLHVFLRQTNAAGILHQHVWEFHMFECLTLCGSAESLLLIRLISFGLFCTFSLRWRYLSWYMIHIPHDSSLPVQHKSCPSTTRRTR